MNNQEGKYQVIISENATQMLIAHARFMAQVSEEVGMNLVEAFSGKAASLERLPLRYPLLNNPYIPHHKYRKLAMGKWFLLLYQVKLDTVYIDYVVDCRQDYQWLLELTPFKKSLGA